MKNARRKMNLAVACLGLALAAGCVVTPRGRVVFFPPPPPFVVVHPPPPPLFVPPPPVVVAPPVVIGPLPGSLMARAEQGDPVAQFTLGSCYANGRGVAPNFAARKLFALYNEKGVFNNLADDQAALETGLRKRFGEVEITRHGLVALFRATKLVTA